MWGRIPANNSPDYTSNWYACTIDQNSRPPYIWPIPTINAIDSCHNVVRLSAELTCIFHINGRCFEPATLLFSRTFIEDWMHILVRKLLETVALFVGTASVMFEAACICRTLIWMWFGSIVQLSYGKVLPLWTCQGIEILAVVGTYGLCLLVPVPRSIQYTPWKKKLTIKYHCFLPF